MPQQAGITNQKQMLTGTSHGHIKFPVDKNTRFLEGIVGQEIQLIILLYGKAIEDIIPLASLITLHRIDRDVAQSGNSITGNRGPHRRDLISVRHDNTYCLIHVKTLALQEVNPIDRSRDHLRLRLVDLVGNDRLRIQRRHSHKNHPSGHEQVIDAMLSFTFRRQAKRLMRTRDSLQPATIKGLVWEKGDIRVHSSLAGQHISHLRILAILTK